MYVPFVYFRDDYYLRESDIIYHKCITCEIKNKCLKSEFLWHFNATTIAFFSSGPIVCFQVCAFHIHNYSRYHICTKEHILETMVQKLRCSSRGEFYASCLLGEAVLQFLKSEVYHGRHHCQPLCCKRTFMHW